MRTVLELCDTAKERSYIMDRAGLSGPQLERYLVALLEHGLLEVEENGFRTTGRWVLFVEKFKGDVEKMCINGRPGHRGCSLVNNRYDQQKKSAD
jgi:predicted transcriptional regulator